MTNHDKNKAQGKAHPGAAEASGTLAVQQCRQPVSHMLADARVDEQKRGQGLNRQSVRGRRCRTSSISL